MTYYVVIRGNQPGIYNSAEVALQAIDNFPNSHIKKFSTEKAAQDFFNQFQQTSQKTLTQTDEIDVYVDGSFDKNSQMYSYGVVFIQRDNVVHTMQRAGNNPKYIDSHQIAGEVFGALAAIKWAIEQNIKKINIHYDYMGIEQWATKSWQAKKPVSKDYVTYFDKLSPYIQINFVKVKAHSGEKYNELADQLAKEALITSN